MTARGYIDELSGRRKSGGCSSRYGRGRLRCGIRLGRSLLSLDLLSLSDRLPSRVGGTLHDNWRPLAPSVPVLLVGGNSFLVNYVKPPIPGVEQQGLPMLLL